MQVYDKKIIISGNVVEVYTYSEKQIKREVREPQMADRSSPGSSEDNYKQKNGYRRKRLLRRLINTNSDELTKFFTLTFKNNVKNLDLSLIHI